METKKLRQKILDLAIHGKLVPQDPNDEPASVLLERIKAEKVSKNPSDKHHYENINFEVPKNWTICTVEDIFELNPKNKLDDTTICGFIPMTLVKEGFGFSHSFEKRKWGEVKKGYCHFRDGDIGIAKISPCFENRKSTIFVNLPNGIGAGTTELSILRGTYVCNKFYLFLFQTDWYIKEGIKYFKGVVGQQRVNKDIFTSLHIPLPPINEQKRIVAKIEELFNTIDIIESNQNDLESLVKQAKTKILDLAIHGKLVSQDPNDEPASELLKRINPNLSESCDNPHYENLPQTWECLKLKETCQLQDGIKAEGDHIILDAKYLRGKTSGTLCNKGKLVKKGELLILVDGENSGEVFTAPCDGYMGSTFKKLCINNELYAPYILYFITLHKDMLRNSKKGAAIPHLNKDIFYNLIIGIPPFEEQKRIVSKIESLFETLDIIKSLVN